MKRKALALSLAFVFLASCGGGGGDGGGGSTGGGTGGGGGSGGTTTTSCTYISDVYGTTLSYGQGRVLSGAGVELPRNAFGEYVISPGRFVVEVPVFSDARCAWTTVHVGNNRGDIFLTLMTFAGKPLRITCDYQRTTLNCTLEGKRPFIWQAPTSGSGVVEIEGVVYNQRGETTAISQTMVRVFFQ